MHSTQQSGDVCLFDIIIVGNGIEILNLCNLIYYVYIHLSQGLFKATQWIIFHQTQGDVILQYNYFLNPISITIFIFYLEVFVLLAEGFSGQVRDFLSARS